MSEINPMEFFQRLLDDFPRSCRRAPRVVFEPPYADRRLQFGVVGFVITSSPEWWGRNQLEFFEQRFRGDLTDEVMEDLVGPDHEGVIAFCCLALGAMLGMHADDRLPVDLFRAWDVYLAAFCQARAEEINQTFRTGMPA